MKFKPLIVLTVILCSFPLFSKYHPEIRWKEISEKKFIVIFPQGYETEAASILETAREVYGELQKLWKIPIEDPIRILITDVNDYANGSATFFPFNQITIHLFPPPPDTALGNAFDWIRLVVSHEMSHIFYLNAGSRFIRSLRDIIGSNPLLYPLNFTPFWMVEGIAVFGESYMNPNGRMKTPDYCLILKNMARTRSVPKWRDIYGEPTYWPGPEAKYLFGCKFIEFLIEEYGIETVPGLVHHFSRYLITLAASHRIRQYFKKSLPKLWSRFIEQIPTPETNFKETVTPLTRCGMSKKYPVALGTDRGVYVSEDYQDFPGVWEIDFKTAGKSKLFEKNNINNLSYSPEDQTIYFSAIDYFKSSYRYSDLYEYKLTGKHVNRLSVGKRLFSPVKVPGKETIICVKRKKNRSYLCLFDKKTKNETIISRGYRGLDFLSLSPDGQTIAASVKRKNHNWDIGLFHFNGKPKKIISLSPQKKYAPRWRTDREIGFICEYNHSYRLVLYNLDSDRARVLAKKNLPAIRHFTFIPGSETVLINHFDSNGYNLGMVDLSTLRFQTFPPQDPFSYPVGTPQPEPVKAKKYRFWRDLLPKFLNVNFRYAGNEIQPGFVLFGNDAVHRHSFSFQGFYGINTESINFSFNYTYEGFYPTLILNLSNLTDLNLKENDEKYTYTTKSAELVMLYPILFTEKYQSYLYANLHSEKIIERYNPAESIFRLNLNGMKLGLLFNSAKHYYDSISHADGLSLSLSYSRDFEFLGSDFDLNTLALEYKQYLSISRPNVLALRLGISNSWGSGKRLFYMGGANSKTDHHIAGGNLFNLMRGYPSGYFSGTGGFILNLEFRIDLVKMERSIFISKRVERFYISLFSDIGNMWEQEITLDPAISLGAEFNMVLYLGKRVTVSGGVAIGRSPFHDPVFYVRVGEAF